MLLFSLRPAEAWPSGGFRDTASNEAFRLGCAWCLVLTRWSGWCCAQPDHLVILHSVAFKPVHLFVPVRLHSVGAYGLLKSRGFARVVHVTPIGLGRVLRPRLNLVGILL